MKTINSPFESIAICYALWYNVKRQKVEFNRNEDEHMSQRMTLNEVISEYGVPQIKLDIHAKGSECKELRKKLMDIVKLSGAKEQGYLDIDCKLYIDVDDIDRYLSGELDTLGEIYAFPDDIKSYREE